MADRECGSCYACCIWLGIKELKKYPGQACKHLCGQGDPTKRCEVYDTRPEACSEYYCGWLAGLGPNNARPDESGLLVTVYPPYGKGTCSATITIIDLNKSGTIHKGPLYEFLRYLLAIGADSIRVLSYKEKSLLHFADGKIHKGKIIPNKKEEYEALNFAASDPPIGSY